MGSGRWDSKTWESYSTTHTRGKSRDQIFNSRSINSDLDPKNIKTRESRDSADNPNATPVILALDVTGSMGMIAENLAREGLGMLVESILERKPVSDPHIMVMGVGDVFYDGAPLQVSQFEADIRIAEQLKNLYLEGGGGGNNHESYTLPWYFAAEKTDVDCVKHGRKGLLFTFGDEECPPDLRADQIKRVLGDKIQHDISTEDLLETVSKKYDVFHVVVEEGSYARTRKADVYQSWNNVLPADRIIPLKDYTKAAAVVVSVMEAYAGKPKADIAASWQGPTAQVVADAIKNVKPSGAPPSVTAIPPIKFKPKNFKLEPKTGTGG